MLKYITFSMSTTQRTWHKGATLCTTHSLGTGADPSHACPRDSLAAWEVAVMAEGKGDNEGECRGPSTGILRACFMVAPAVLLLPQALNVYRSSSVLLQLCPSHLFP